ncbi:MAG: alpha-N-arabinofuranosidase [Ruminiclostridium sp.]|nr:alpha-N-arabinofuranosidase [Ruminiclostridium sp.]
MKNIKMVINPLDKKSHINKEIYGHFAEHLGRCIYNGIYVGEDFSIPNTCGIRNDVIEAFKKIGMPVLRWPGGCFADTYHWKDGIGNKEDRKKMINVHWGGVTEDNSFGTHEFFKLCELVGCEPYIAGNLGSGSVQEMAEWVEYMTSDDVSPMADLRRSNGQEKAWKLKYFGIGNENWGCGGSMSPEYYSDEYKRYQCFCRDYSGNQLFKIACGPNAFDYNWTEVIMKNITPWNMKGISLHFYTVPYANWADKGSATVFSDDDYYATIEETLRMEELLTRHSEIMNRYDPEHKVGLIVDEWGCWFNVEEGTNPGFLYQQNTMRDAIVASINLNLFNKHSDRVIMANLAQVVNVLQSVILTEGEEMILTPTFHVFDLYKCHHDNTLIYSYTENDKVEGKNYDTISQSASVDDNGNIYTTISNCSLTESYKINLNIIDSKVKKTSARILTGDVRDYNDFGGNEKVKPAEYEVINENGELFVIVPPCSVISVELITE